MHDFETLMEVSSHRIDHHEGGCDIVSIESGETDGAVALNFLCWAEGEEWEDRQVWTVEQDAGRTLLSRKLRNGEFETDHKQCSTPAVSASSARSYCYDDGQSQMKITVLDASRVWFGIDSVQGNAHMCGLEGVASVIPGGLRYSESIAGIGECRLDILFFENRSVRFEDSDWICKQQYCGARAAFEHIKISGIHGKDC